MDKSATAHEKPGAGHAEKGAAPEKGHAGKGAEKAAKPAGGGGSSKSGPAVAGPMPIIPVDDAKRVGSFAAVAGWVFGLIAGIVITALIGARPAYLFGVVGVPIVLASYLFGTFAGGRVVRTYLRDFIKN